MKRKHTVKKRTASKKLSNTKIMFLSFILLFIIFEALFIQKGQQESLQANSSNQQVAGVQTHK